MSHINDNEPNEQFSGVTREGETWCLARFGTLVTLVIEGEEDTDEQYATTDEAHRHYVHQLDIALGW